MRAGGGFAVLDLGEEPDEEYAEEAENRGPAEDVDVGPEQCLLAESLIKHSVGLGDGVGGIREAAKRGVHLRGSHLEPRLGLGDGTGNLALVKIGAADEKRL